MDVVTERVRGKYVLECVFIFTVYIVAESLFLFCFLFKTSVKNISDWTERQS